MVVKLVVAGAAGRMGSRIVDLAQKSKEFSVVYKLETKPPRLEEALGFGHTASLYGSDYSQISKADAVIDFTVPEATIQIASKTAEYRKPIVIGTTGFSPAQEKHLKKILKSVPVLKSANMSLAVNVLFKLAKDTAKVLKHYGIEIEETHHVHKKDKPSGTALQLGKIMEEYLENKITYTSKREGEVVGDHRIIFTGLADKFELFHHAESRDIFVIGALFAAKWLVKQKPGFYTMQDALGLK